MSAMRGQGSPPKSAPSSSATTPHRRWGRVSIGAHLVVLVAIQIVLVWTLIGFSALQDFRRARTDAEAQMRKIAKLATGTIADEMKSNYDSLAALPGIISNVSTADLCKSANAPTPQSERTFFIDVHLVHYDGTPVCPENAHDPNFSRAPWFTAALTSEDPVLRGPLVDPVSHQNSMVYAIAIPERKFVLAYPVRMSSVGPVLDGQFGSGPMPPAFTVVSKDAKVEIASSGGKTGRSLAGTRFTSPVTKQHNVFADAGGVQRIYADADMKEFGWRVYAGISTKDAYAGAARALRERLVFGFVILGLVLLAAAVLQQRFLKPIRSLFMATQAFRDGDQNARVVPEGPKELSELAVGFNEMMHVRAAAEKALQRAYAAEQHANAELREIDTLRKSFLMAISHELRTPLTAVAGYAALLDEGLEWMPQDEVKMSVGAIVESSKRLERLLIDLLDIERLSRGVIEPNRMDVDIREMVQGVVQRSGGKDRIRVAAARSLRAFVDPALIERVLENLVSNAIKHTPPDTTIWVRAVRRRTELSLIVEDNGPGVPNEIRETVFEAFKQGKPKHSPGTGVGLALVAQFAKLHGGRAWLEDRKGGGSVFHVVVPAAEIKRNTRTPRAAAA
jgi:signal transduction histidine kinase